MLSLLYPQDQLDYEEMMALDYVQGIDYSQNLDAKHRQSRDSRYCSHVILKPTTGNKLGRDYSIVEIWTESYMPIAIACFVRSHYNPEKWHLIEITPFNYD
jgi:hypothetical protein